MGVWVDGWVHCMLAGCLAALHRWLGEGMRDGMGDGMGNYYVSSMHL